jgi:hypothetical protein
MAMIALHKRGLQAKVALGQRLGKSFGFYTNKGKSAQVVLTLIFKSKSKKKKLKVVKPSKKQKQKKKCF